MFSFSVIPILTFFACPLSSADEDAAAARYSMSLSLGQEHFQRSEDMGDPAGAFQTWGAAHFYT